MCLYFRHIVPTKAFIYILDLPWVVAVKVMYKLRMIRISVSIQDIHHRCSAFTSRLRSVRRIIIRTQVAFREAGTESEDLPSQRAVLDCLAIGDHVQRCLT